MRGLTCMNARGCGGLRPSRKILSLEPLFFFLEVHSPQHKTEGKGNKNEQIPSPVPIAPLLENWLNLCFKVLDEVVTCFIKVLGEQQSSYLQFIRRMESIYWSQAPRARCCDSHPPIIEDMLQVITPKPVHQSVWRGKCILTAVDFSLQQLQSI